MPRAAIAAFAACRSWRLRAAWSLRLAIRSDINPNCNSTNPNSGNGGAVTRTTGEVAPAREAERYEQELSRSLRVVGNVMITLSSITPASSVFIIIPAILVGVGTGSFLALVFSALVGAFM